MSADPSRYDRSRVSGLTLPSSRVTNCSSRLFRDASRSFPTCQRSLPAVNPHSVPKAKGRPRRALSGRYLPFLSSYQAAMAKAGSVLSAPVFVAPFNESEQLGSHDELAVSPSKPVSPVRPPVYRARRGSERGWRPASAGGPGPPPARPRAWPPDRRWHGACRSCAGPGRRPAPPSPSRRGSTRRGAPG